jgi:DNA-binding transcriptional LysR family regulator
MNKREIALLWEVARTGSVTQAAEATHMSQPAASAAIRQIEARVGFELFTREKRRLVFTPKGRAMLPEISNTLAAHSSLDRLVEELRLEGARRVIVGCIASAATTVLPQAAKVFRDALPQVRMVVRTGMSVDIANMVAEQRVDFGLIVGDDLPQGCGAADIATLGLYAVMRPEDPLAAYASITLEQVNQQPYVALARQLQIGALLARKFEEAGMNFNPTIEVMQFSSACSFIQVGYGIAILDALSLPFAKQVGLVVRPMALSDRVMFRLLWPKNTPLVRHAGAFRDALQCAVEGGTDPTS